MKLHTTASPGCVSFTSGATSATTPEISCPRTQGSGNDTSPFITCRSVWQTPQAATLISTSLALGDGRGISSTVRRPPTSERTAAFILEITPFYRSSGYENSSNNALASCTSLVSNPSVNQP